MNPREYEELVADIIAQFPTTLDAQLNQTTIVLGNVKAVGKSGQSHQIDVWVEFRRFGLLYRTIIECKCWDRPVGVEPVMVLAQRMEDLGAQKGVLVTTLGFQSGAYRLASSKGIALVLCRGKGEFLVELRRESSSGSALMHQEDERVERGIAFRYYYSSYAGHLELTTLPTLLEALAI